MHDMIVAMGRIETWRTVLVVVLMLVGSASAIAESVLPKFMGREVTIHQPELEDDIFPKGPASICIEGPPQRQCYTAPKDFGLNPTVAIVQLLKDSPALLFSTESGGVSGWQVHLALLVPGTGKSLGDVFLSDTTVSNQSQHVFWNEPSISEAQIFLTANYIWGSDEGHYGKHRYVISAYVMKRHSTQDEPAYFLEDRYMTIAQYDLDAKQDVLGSEKGEIVSRLRRIRAAREAKLTP